MESENGRPTIDSTLLGFSPGCENRTSNWIFGSRERRLYRGELVVWNEGENVPGVDCGGAAGLAAAQDDFGSKALFGANGGTDRTNETEA